MHNGCILCGGVGVGKSHTAVQYYLENEVPRDVYVITTAKKRDKGDWQKLWMEVGMHWDPELTMGAVVIVDSWENIKKYTEVKNGFFIFDEQRLVGTGAWSKAFYKIAAANRWIMLSATPGDNWLDYVPVFRANGFIKNITQFKEDHVLQRWTGRYYQITGYRQVPQLVRWRNSLLVDMPYEKHTVRHAHDVSVTYDKDIVKELVNKRWHVYEKRPLTDASELFRVMRKVVYSDASRLDAIRSLLARHPKLIVFYNFDYELEILRTLRNPSSESLTTSEKSLTKQTNKLTSNHSGTKSLQTESTKSGRNTSVGGTVKDPKTSSNETSHPSDTTRSLQTELSTEESRTIQTEAKQLSQKPSSDPNQNVDGLSGQKHRLLQETVGKQIQTDSLRTDPNSCSHEACLEMQINESSDTQSSDGSVLIENPMLLESQLGRSHVSSTTKTESPSQQSSHQGGVSGESRKGSGGSSGALRTTTTSTKLSSDQTENDFYLNGTWSEDQGLGEMYLPRVSIHLKNETERSSGSTGVPSTPSELLTYQETKDGAATAESFRSHEGETCQNLYGTTRDDGSTNPELTTQCCTSLLKTEKERSLTDPWTYLLSPEGLRENECLTKRRSTRSMASHGATPSTSTEMGNHSSSLSTSSGTSMQTCQCTPGTTSHCSKHRDTTKPSMTGTSLRMESFESPTESLEPMSSSGESRMSSLNRDSLPIRTDSCELPESQTGKKHEEALSVEENATAKAASTTSLNLRKATNESTESPDHPPRKSTNECQKEIDAWKARFQTQNEVTSTASGQANDTSKVSDGSTGLETSLSPSTTNRSSKRLKRSPGSSTIGSDSMSSEQFQVAEWNGHKHEDLPTTTSWVYLVQYVAGAEAWECTDTDAMVFYSMPYSYKLWWQAHGRIDRLSTLFTDLHYYTLWGNSMLEKAVRASLKAKKSFNESAFYGNLGSLLG